MTETEITITSKITKTHSTLQRLIRFLIGTSSTPMISRSPGSCQFPNLDRAFSTSTFCHPTTRCTTFKMTVLLSWRHTPWLVLSILSLISFASAHMIEVTASRKECFFEDLHEHDQMTVTYQVGEGGHLDIDFWVRLSYQCRLFSRETLLTPCM